MSDERPMTESAAETPAEFPVDAEMEPSQLPDRAESAATDGDEGGEKRKKQPYRPLEPADIVDSPWKELWRDILGGGALRSILAIIFAVFLGSLLVIVTNEDFQEAAGYFFAKPGDAFAAAGSVLVGAFRSLWEGAVFSPRTGFLPLTQTLMWSTPLIIAGLGIGLGFKAGLFNIGGRGQMLVAALFTGFVGSSIPLPYGLHLLAAVIAGILGGALWAAIAGWLKAQTGAHEVVVTIMLNYIAWYGLTYLLKMQPFQAEGVGGNPKAKPIPETAALPDLVGAVDLGFVLALLAVVAFWWILNRSTIGFNIRAVGINPHAARTAGISVGRVTVLAMAISGGFLGLAGATQVLGRATAGYDPSIDAGIGFEGITVALLGANHPVGILLAGLLFGALKAGSFPMQVVEGIPIDIVAVFQGLIVLLIAAPPLVRAIFRLPKPSGVSLVDRFRAARALREREAVAAAGADAGAANGVAAGAGIDKAGSSETAARDANESAAPIDPTEGHAGSGPGASTGLEEEKK